MLLCEILMAYSRVAYSVLILCLSNCYAGFNQEACAFQPPAEGSALQRLYGFLKFSGLVGRRIGI